jgi:hypothetical protein
MIFSSDILVFHYGHVDGSNQQDDKIIDDMLKFVVYIL